MRRKYRQLTRENRYQIRALLDAGKSADETALILQFHRSTIFRELKRGSVKARSAHWGECAYKPGWAHKAYLLRRSNLREWHPHVKIKGRLEEKIREKLFLAWSPEQIANRLRLEKQTHVSHEAIYRYIAWDKRYGGDLYKCLRQYGHYRKRYGRVRRLRAPVANRTPISARPAEANFRTEFGHWERDLVIGKIKDKRALLTLVDRKSRYTLIEPVSSKKPEEILKATALALRQRGRISKTVTNDNGLEFMDHLELTKTLAVSVYFARPYAAWERGTNENTNGLLRQYYPKRKSLADVSQEELVAVENSLNLRPRRVLGYLTPKEMHFGKRERLFARKTSRYISRM